MCRAHQVFERVFEVTCKVAPVACVHLQTLQYQRKHRHPQIGSNQGLLAEISAEDLRNTDIYVVRVSDGKLISERIGLNEYETSRIGAFGEDAGNSRFFYTIQMQGGTGDKRFRYDMFDDWQAASGINPDLHQRQSDHLQPGDAIRIYAINRATGYIGHVDTVMQAGTLSSGDLSFHIDPIVMGPPNLKIRAERGYKIQSGATKTGDTITQLIGFEGASLTSDTTVTITTEWLDHDGRPLPESLAGAGYTGRIAILSGDKTLSTDNQGVYQFSIDPGRRLQVLQLPNALTGSEHFYIHVSGEPQNGNPIFAGSTDSQRLREADFSSSGQNPGILAKRPDNYVPFLVPIYDETTSELQTQAYRALKQTNPNQFNQAPEPIYRWVYRPEMQFTSYDLTVSEINKTRDADYSGTIEPEETVNIKDDETPLITSDSVVDILYGLSTTDLLPLDYFNAGDSKELIFAIGEQEVTATLGADQRIIFGDLSHLDLLSPDDFLTIRLYANNDMGNTLWQWAFMNLDVDVDSDNNNGLDLPDRTPEEEAIENVDGEPGKILYVNTADSDNDGIPDFADFDPGQGFAPMVVQIPDDVDIATARIKFTYEESDPTIIDVDNSVDPPIYTPDGGYLRLWTKNGTESRNVSDITAGGNFIRADQEINLTLFTIDVDTRVLVLYTELVREKGLWGGHNVRTEIIE